VPGPKTSTDELDEIVWVNFDEALKGTLVAVAVEPATVESDDNDIVRRVSGTTTLGEEVKPPRADELTSNEVFVELENGDEISFVFVLDPTTFSDELDGIVDSNIGEELVDAFAAWPVVTAKPVATSMDDVVWPINGGLGGNVELLSISGVEELDVVELIVELVDGNGAVSLILVLDPTLFSEELVGNINANVEEKLVEALDDWPIVTDWPVATDMAGIVGLVGGVMTLGGKVELLVITEVDELGIVEVSVELLDELNGIVEVNIGEEVVETFATWPIATVRPVAAGIVGLVKGATTLGEKVELPGITDIDELEIIEDIIVELVDGGEVPLIVVSNSTVVCVE